VHDDLVVSQGNYTEMAGLQQKWTGLVDQVEEENKTQKQ